MLRHRSLGSCNGWIRPQPILQTKVGRPVVGDLTYGRRWKSHLGGKTWLGLGSGPVWVCRAELEGADNRRILANANACRRSAVSPHLLSPLASLSHHSKSQAIQLG